jgi:hypothetical protein
MVDVGARLIFESQDDGQHGLSSLRLELQYVGITGGLDSVRELGPCPVAECATSTLNEDS